MSCLHDVYKYNKWRGGEGTDSPASISSWMGWLKSSASFQKSSPRRVDFQWSGWWSILISSMMEIVAH